jgi:hypothetical protein
MTSLKRGGTRKKAKAKRGWRDPLASLRATENMSRRQEDIEDVSSYLHKLTQEEKLWMAKFMDEYNNAKYDANNLKNNMHNTPELKKSITDRNNSRNRCIYTREKAEGALNYAGSDAELEAYIYGSRDQNEDEEEDIDVIDEI